MKRSADDFESSPLAVGARLASALVKTNRAVVDLTRSTALLLEDAEKMGDWEKVRLAAAAMRELTDKLVAQVPEGLREQIFGKEPS